MKILICDDSSMARNSLTRILNSKYSCDLFYAENGLEALKIMQNTSIDILFLDITMPVMDGFEVLASLPVNSHRTRIIIVSGDVQESAMERCLALGAELFIQKPLQAKFLHKALNSLNCVPKIKESFFEEPTIKKTKNIDFVALFREMANIAMGKSAAVLSNYFNMFIKMPIPNVAILTIGELQMAIEDVRKNNNSSSISQRFVGGGMYGEALVSLHGKELISLGKKMGIYVDGDNIDEVKLELGNILVSSFIASISEQLDVRFSLRQPQILNAANGWFGLNDELGVVQNQFYSVEYLFSSTEVDLQCEVLFLMSETSVPALKQLMELSL